MWMKCTVKKDIMLRDLLKMFKNKDMDVILQHPKNKEAVKAHRAKKPIPKGTIVWLLDPGVTVYIVTKPNGKKEVVEEKDYKDSLKKANKTMDFALKQFQSMHDTMIYRHDIQNKALNDFYITSLFTASWWGEEGREPVAQKKASAAAVKKLAKVVKARDYGKFEPAVRDADAKVRAYGKGIDAYISQHTGSSENWETFAVIVRDGGFVVFGALAMTVAAPATAAATLGYGAVVGGGTSLLSSSANEAGRHISGQNVTFTGSAKTVLKDVVVGAAFGALCAGAARAISGKLISKFAERMASSGTISSLIAKLSGWKFWPQLGRRVYERELTALMKSLSTNLADDAAGALIKITPEVLNRMTMNVTIKVLTRGGVGTVKKLTEKAYGKFNGEAWSEKFMKDNAMKLKGTKSDDEIAEQMVNELLKDPMAAEALKVIIEGNSDKIEAELQKEIRKEFDRQLKKAKKKAKK